jgi:alkanesulfonate monooxygenase SsuD/methylene tetrahydromethanopterin reductase-like flavin-dependent oxidoreductase (luciferase family)
MLGEAPAADSARARQVAETAQVLRLLWKENPATFEGRHFQLRRATGYLQPKPPPPIIVGGFGPRVATIAGRFADGFNAPAGMPGLAALIERARNAHESAGRTDSFEISVFSGLSRSWLDAGSRDRGELNQLGVSRLILQIAPPYPIDEIRRAGALLGAL